MDLALNMPAALEYAHKHGLHALAIRRGDLLAQEFGAGHGPDVPHPLYSGTKSFWGVAATYAAADGLLALDEPVAETIASWREDPWKRRVTIRMLLSLTSGFGFGGLGASVPTYDRALATPLRDEPGTRFVYGGIPLQIFGAVMANKLAPRAMTPQEYLRERVLDRAGVRIARWRTLADGTHPLPTGASLTPLDWLAYGRFVLANHSELGDCFVASAANQRYGLGWWLHVRGVPDDLFYASGSAGQALYLVPSLDLAIVHFGKSSSYRHESFLKRCFT
ncbi:MAG TPA: serine hydrolase domain-containing protein [Candidatus Cybelea sp.]|jgi:CubicO group peptidase (beta-lactamase class C family)|nr:serine hydrolase domain-containing protein [Candidatus Cybelea sp.]